MPKQQAQVKPEPEAAEPVAANVASPTADELDAIGAKFTRKEAWHTSETTPEIVREEDMSPCDEPETVPDGPFHGKWNLLVGVDFVNGDGDDVHIDAGLIEGSDLPVAFAEDLAERGQLVKT